MLQAEFCTSHCTRLLTKPQERFFFFFQNARLGSDEIEYVGDLIDPVFLCLCVVCVDDC